MILDRLELIIGSRAADWLRRNQGDIRLQGTTVLFYVKNDGPLDFFLCKTLKEAEELMNCTRTFGYRYVCHVPATLFKE